MNQNTDFSMDNVNYGFTGITTFMRSPQLEVDKLSESNQSIAVLGIPFDEGAPFMPGSRFGPRTIREHSLRFSRQGIYNHRKKKMQLTEELSLNRMVDLGDINVIPTDVEGTFNKISKTVKEVIDKNIMLITIGGDHSITYPVVRAISKPVHVIHFDAHADFLPIRPGYEHTNSHAFTHISKMSHVKSLTLIGYRSIREPSGIDYEEQGNRVVDMDEFRDLGPLGVSHIIPEGEDCYITIDIDVLDSSIVPGCVSAEPDGLLYRELRDTLSKIAARNPILGYEIVEVSPQLDVGTGITSYIAAQTLIELLGEICDQEWWEAKK